MINIKNVFSLFLTLEISYFQINSKIIILLIMKGVILQAHAEQATCSGDEK